MDDSSLFLVTCCLRFKGHVLLAQTLLPNDVRVQRSLCARIGHFLTTSANKILYQFMQIVKLILSVKRALGLYARYAPGTDLLYNCSVYLYEQYVKIYCTCTVFTFVHTLYSKRIVTYSELKFDNTRKIHNPSSIAYSAYCLLMQIIKNIIFHDIFQYKLFFNSFQFQ